MRANGGNMKKKYIVSDVIEPLLSVSFIIALLVYTVMYAFGFIR